MARNCLQMEILFSLSFVSLVQSQQPAAPAAAGVMDQAMDRAQLPHGLNLAHEAEMLTPEQFTPSPGSAGHIPPQGRGQAVLHFVPGSLWQLLYPGFITLPYK